ncbi:MAG: nucleotide sugar dehydrogenase [Lentisphaeria bacterium]|nr:nucleotide sugar dehydrogenase [Lentisphaeria bacterium]
MKEIKKVAIIGGCGHVGIPLGLALADRGFTVTLLDKNEKAVQLLNEGKLPFIEDGAEVLLRKYVNKTLFITMDPVCLKEQHCVIFVTGTPVDEHLNAKVHAVLDVVKEYLPLLTEEQLIVLRSTLYPGTVRIVENMLLRSNFKCKLAFCPERILQGKGIKEIFELPQLVSGCSEEAEKEASFLFGKVAKKIILLSPEEAELAKLMTNSWRYLEFAIANQFYMIAEAHGVDFYKVYNAMTDDYPRARHFPRPGLAAGPCLFKDTMQLASYHDNGFFLGHSAMLVNEGLPNLLVEQLAKKMGGSLKNKKIAILGMTFKANNDDIRESLSFKIRKLLEQKMAFVLPSDPYLKETLPLEKALEEAEGIIIGTPHDAYKELVLSVPFADCWGIIRKE